MCSLFLNYLNTRLINFYVNLQYVNFYIVNISRIKREWELKAGNKEKLLDPFGMHY